MKIMLRKIGIKHTNILTSSTMMFMYSYSFALDLRSSMTLVWRWTMEPSGRMEISTDCLLDMI